MRERLWIVLLAAFVAIDIVLVVLAVRHTSTGPRSSGQSQSVIISGAPSPSRSADGATGSSSPAAESGPVLLAVTSQGVVLRADHGSCSDAQPPIVEVSGRHGRRLHETTVDGLSQVLSMRAVQGDLTVIGLDQNCSTATFSSGDDGATWAPTPGDDASWHVVAAGRRQVVVTPAGRRRTPCAPKALAPIDSRAARLLCGDGRIEGTGDGGDSWVLLGSLDGAVDLSFQGVGDGVAVAVQDGCPAAFMRTVDGGTTWTRVTCLQGGAPRAVTLSGAWAVAQVGGRLQLSTDSGGSWRKVSG